MSYLKENKEGTKEARVWRGEREGEKWGNYNLKNIKYLGFHIPWIWSYGQLGTYTDIYAGETPVHIKIKNILKIKVWKFQHYNFTI